jgi:hypothetical protein
MEAKQQEYCFVLVRGREMKLQRTMRNRWGQKSPSMIDRLIHDTPPKSLPPKEVPETRISL